MLACLLAAALVGAPAASANVPDVGSDPGQVQLLPARTIERTSVPTPGTSLPADSHSNVASADEQQLFTLTNRERTSRQLRALTWDEGLATGARAHALQMSLGGNLYHNPNLVAEVTATVPVWQGTGENVGTGSTIAAIHAALMNSPGHRANILGEFTSVGIGVVTGTEGNLWIAQVFVREDGAPAPAPPPPAPPAPDPAPERRPPRERDSAVVQSAVSTPPPPTAVPVTSPTPPRGAEPSGGREQRSTRVVASPSAATPRPVWPALGMLLLALAIVGADRRRSLRRGTEGNSGSP